MTFFTFLELIYKVLSPNDPSSVVDAFTRSSDVLQVLTILRSRDAFWFRVTGRVDPVRVKVLFRF